MTGRDTVLLAHIALGTAGLILGPVAMTARKLPGLHTKAGEAYHWVISLWAWALPTVVGTPLIAWVTREVARGRRPKL